MVSRTQSCYDDNVMVVTSNPNCDYSASFVFAIREKASFSQHLTHMFRLRKRITLISEAETKFGRRGKSFNCRKSHCLAIKAQKQTAFEM